MRTYADLHLHSRFAFNTSPALTVDALCASAARVGLGVIGSGDALHPVWRAELRRDLEPAAEGLYRHRSGAGPLVMATVELSTIYRRDDRARRVHHLVHLPDLDAADALADALGGFSNLAGDGRPMFKLDSRELFARVLDAVPDAFLVPAHIWTPWYGVLGENSGFHSLEDCYGDLAGEIFAIETGLSADAEMIRRVSALDRCRLLSGSDAHGLANLGREATVFDVAGPSFAAIRRALATGEGYLGTVESFPEHGKYHWDGHRACGIRRDPAESKGPCPVCGKPLTIGVANRVAALADRDEGEGAARVGHEARHVLPLAEILAGLGHKGGKLARARTEALDVLGPELPLLLDLPGAEIAEHDAALAAAIGRMRLGAVVVEPGYDGVIGRVSVA